MDSLDLTEDFYFFPQIAKNYVVETIWKHHDDDDCLFWSLCVYDRYMTPFGHANKSKSDFYCYI